MKYLEVAALRPGRLLALAAVVTLLLGGAWLVPPARSPSPPTATGGLLQQPQDAPEVLNPKQYLTLRFHEGDSKTKAATMCFGLTLPEQPVLGTPGDKKRLTFDPFGHSNNTCLKIEGIEQLLGRNSGRWQVRKEALGRGRIGYRSVWVTDDLPIKVTQTVELVRGSQTRKLDTCRVLYTLENTSKKQDYLVGLRFLLDTVIGTNDGAPFIVPGEEMLCETARDLRGDRIPPFVQAPGGSETVASAGDRGEPATETGR